MCGRIRARNAFGILVIVCVVLLITRIFLGLCLGSCSCIFIARLRLFAHFLYHRGTGS